MTVKQIVAHAHTKQKNSFQPILAMTLARYLPGTWKNTGDLYDEWLKRTQEFAYTDYDEGK